MNDSEYFLFETQLAIVKLTLELAESNPKRDSIFETKYKTENGKEITVARSPDGKFANKGGGKSGTEPTQTDSPSVTHPIAQNFSEFFKKTGKLLNTMSEDGQKQVRKLIFDSELSKGVRKTAKEIAAKVNDPNLTAGLNLGQRINDELAKKPFSEFGQIVVDKFAEFRKELPQKTEDLKKEIVRISKDPNTSATIATGALMALAGYFHVTGFIALWRAGAPAYHSLKILPALITGDINLAQAMSVQVLAITVVGAHLVEGVFRNIVATVLTSQAGRVTLDRVKANAQVENNRLNQEILVKKQSSGDLYQQHLDQKAKDTETRQKILEELSKGLPKSRTDLNPDKPETLATLPVIDVKLSDTEEEFAAEPKHREQILAKAYNDEEILKLSFAYYEAQGLALVAALSDEQVGEKFAEIAEQTHKAINDRFAVVIKAEIKRLRELNLETAPLFTIESEVDNAVREELKKINSETKINLFVDAVSTPSIVEGIKNTSIDDVINGDNDAFTNAFNFMQSQMDLAAKAVSKHKKELAIGAAAVACVAATSILTLASGIAVRSLIGDIVVELVAGKGLSEAGKTALTQLSVARVKAGLKKPIIVVLLGFKIGKKIVEEIQKQVNNSPDRPSATEKQSEDR